MTDLQRLCFYALEDMTLVELNDKYFDGLGMLPPAVEILSDHYNRNEGRMGFDSNEWESED